MLLALALAARAQQAVERLGRVLLGGRTVVELRADAGGAQVGARAERATRRLALALADDACGPEGFEVEAIEGGDREIRLCSQVVLRVSETDAALEQTTVEALALEWAHDLRLAFEQERSAAWSDRLFDRALLGLLYPLGWMLALFATHLAFARLRRTVIAAPTAAPGRAWRLLEGEADRRIVARLLIGLEWLSYFLWTYLFLGGLFRLVPATSRWAQAMLAPLSGIAEDVATGLLSLVPRLALIVVIVVAARLAFGAVGRLFQKVRRGQVQFPPIVTAENAGPAELGVRILLLVVAVALVVFALPGESATTLIAAWVVLGLTIGYGARERIADVAAGVVTLYGRNLRRGREVRFGRLHGTIRTKGWFALLLETEDGRRLLVPNRLLFRQPIEIATDRRLPSLLVALESERGLEHAEALFRHAAALAGLAREGGRIALIGYRERAWRFEVSWTIDAEAERPQAIAAFLDALVEKAPALGLRVVEVRELSSREG